MSLKVDGWPEAESIILTSAKYSYWYALNVIHNRWPEAEPVIVTDAEYSYYYAFNLIKGRWSEAEPIIMNSSFRFSYQRNFLNQ